ncbi:YhdP family protein [Thermodesulfatator atlanticus]|uniref:YhdP family protein n=1 Tax=Thermodesulfatator atlanticus TaxID=501497 RepID=UPI0003B350C5|nr:AsmA-like C-terminal domain-containing protein [Thermodesulfatator atlanticus]
MKKKLKIFAAAVGITLFLLIFLIGIAIFSLPYFVNLNVVKERIANRIAQKLHAEVSIETAKIHLLPRPKVKIKNLTIKAPKYIFTLKEGDLVLELKPLFHKKIVVEKFILMRPEFIKIKGNKPPPLITPELVFAKARELLPKLPPFEVQIEKGSIFFATPGQKLPVLTDISAKLALQPDFLELETKALNPSLKKLWVSLRLWPKEELAEGLIRIKHLDISGLAPLAEKPFLAPFKTDLNLDFSYHFEEGKWLVGFTGTAPCFVKNANNPSLLFDCSAFVGKLIYAPDFFRFDLKDLAMKNPEVSATGFFLKTKKETSFDFHITNGDWTEIRKRLLSLFPENRGLKTLCEIVVAGKAKDIRLKSRAPSPEKLFYLDNFSYEGYAEDGIIDVPSLNIRLEDVSGYASVKKAILKVKNGKGRFLKTRLSNVALELNLRKLKDHTSPLIFTGDFDTNFSDLMAFLYSLPLPDTIESELKILKGKGELSGEADIAGTLKQPDISFAFTPRNLFLEYRRFPLPATLNAGKISYARKKVSLSGVNIRFPQSVLTLSGSLDTSSKPYFLNLIEARGEIAISEIKKVLNMFPEEKELAARCPFEGYKIKLIYANYKGPLVKEALLKDLALKAETQNFSIVIDLLPAPLILKKTTFTYKNFTLSFEPTEAQILDAHFLGTGEISLKPFKIFLSGEGSSQREFVSWIYKRGKIPMTFFPKTPLKFNSLEFAFSPKKLSFSGSWQQDEKAHAKLSFWKHKDGFLLEASFYPYEDKGFYLKINKNNHWDLVLKGSIDHQGIEKFLAKNPFLLHYLKADFSAHINKRHLTESSFYGNLVLSRFRFPPPNQNIWIEELKLKAKGHKLNVENLEFDLNGSSFEGQGKIFFTRKFLNLEGSLYSPELEIEDLLRFYKQKKKDHQKSDIALIAQLDFTCDSVTYKNFEFSPIEGTIFTNPQKFQLVIKEGHICGISFYGDYEKRKSSQKLRLYFGKKEGHLEKTLFCLFHQKTFEGPFNLKGELLTSGKSKLFEKTSGEVSFSSKNGRIRKFGLLAKLFGILSPIDIFQGNLPDFEKEGMTYNSLNLKGKFEKDYLKVEALNLNAPGLRFFASGKIYFLDKKLSLTALVSPFKTFDTVVSNVPLVGWVLTGKSKMFVGVPLRITGKLNDPTIIPLDPTSLGTHFLGIIQRTFKLPVRILTPGK